MSKITIKIVEIDQRTQSSIVKFASEHSKKSIDEYDALAFNVSNYNSLTPEDFAKTILPQISRLVAIRDRSEVLVESLDLSSWHGFSTVVDSIDEGQAAPAELNQMPAVQQTSEVTV